MKTKRKTINKEYRYRLGREEKKTTHRSIEIR